MSLIQYLELDMPVNETMGTELRHRVDAGSKELVAVKRVWNREVTVWQGKDGYVSLYSSSRSAI